MINILHIFQREFHTWPADWAILWATDQYKTRFVQCARTWDCLGMFNLVIKPLLNNHTQNQQSKPRILRYIWITFYIYFRENFTLGKQTELSYGPQTNGILDLYNVPEPRDCLGWFNLVIMPLLNNHIQNQQSKPRILRYMWSTFYIYFREKFTLDKEWDLMGHRPMEN